MGSITKASVLLLLLLAFIFVASDEVAGAAEVTADVEAEKMMLVANTCYWRNDAFGVCLVTPICNNDCIKKGYKKGGMCRGVRRQCFCMKDCITMDV